MLSQKIRKEFLQYFKNKGHTIVPSSPVVPLDDPTLLFVNAGMNQFKDVFLGKATRDYQRATSSQKCIRVGGKHNDLDNVGHTTRHMTFFEMLGNFSFGDYFKEQAIAYAWEMSTEVFQFPEEKIWVSVYEEDDEAYELWKKHINEKHIVRLGKKDNFWSMGDTGPCGPCSELLFDRGDQFGSATSPANDPSGERFLEYWNLVFMQYNLAEGGKMSLLPKQSVDTGAGLERVVSLKMGVNSSFHTDIFKTLIGQIESVFDVRYDPNDTVKAPAFHVIADHLRSLSFAIADGAQPSNVDRGYVLRKILRRAVRYGRLLGRNEPFLAKVLPTLVDIMGDDYHELKTSQNRIAETLTIEEEGFFRTLKRGGNILGSIIQTATASATKEITGEDAFKLKDTYGFPLEEILLIAKDTNLTVNLDSYELLDEQAREKSKKAHKSHTQQVEENQFEEIVQKHGTSEFVGYEENETESTIVAMIKDGEFVNTLEEGESALILLDKTPFYSEKGGQVGDHGDLLHHQAHFIVQDCTSPRSGVIVHHGVLSRGVMIVGEPVVARINTARRHSIENNHSATHLLHYALQQVLGEHVRQAGSLVDPEGLRFDFHHHKAVSHEELRAVEKLINSKIREGHEVHTHETALEEAQKQKEIKQFFGDKYGSTVRVVSIAGFSKELCGGTHASSIQRLGNFRITKETSIAKGVRRIEATTGYEAEVFTYKQEDYLYEACKELDATPSQLSEKLEHLLKEKDALKQQVKKLRGDYINTLSSKLKSQVEIIHHIPVICAKVDLLSDELFAFSSSLESHVPDGIICIAIETDGKCQLLIKVADSLVKKGIKAGALIKEIAPLVGGSGGGKDSHAQAGGTSPKGIPEAFQKFKQLITQSC